MKLEGLRIQEQKHCAVNYKEGLDNINCAYTAIITNNKAKADM